MKQLVVVLSMLLVVCITHARVPNKPNRVSLVLAHGYTGTLHKVATQSSVDVQPECGTNVGIILQRDLAQDVHITGGLLSNDTVMFGFGKAF